MADISTAPQASAPQASLKITLSRKTVVRVLAIFIVLGLSFVLAIALGMALWVLADR
jgi:hypothetical protein